MRFGFGVWGLGFGVWGSPDTGQEKYDERDCEAIVQDPTLKHVTCYGLGFGVWGLGFGVWGLGVGVWGLGGGVAFVTTQRMTTASDRGPRAHPRTCDDDDDDDGDGDDDDDDDDDDDNNSDADNDDGGRCCCCCCCCCSRTGIGPSTGTFTSRLYLKPVQ